MHLGHDSDDPKAPPTALVDANSPFLSSFGGTCGVGRFAMAAIAALTTCTKGGFIPHAKHGGNGVRAFAVAGSKFEGTGLEKEHIGHTHVALRGGADGGAGLPRRSGVIEVLPDAAGGPRESRFEGLG